MKLLLLHLIIEKAIFRVDHVKYCRRNRRWVDAFSMLLSTNSFVFLSFQRIIVLTLVAFSIILKIALLAMYL